MIEAIPVHFSRHSVFTLEHFQHRPQRHRQSSTPNIYAFRPRRLVAQAHCKCIASIGMQLLTSKKLYRALVDPLRKPPSVYTHRAKQSARKPSEGTHHRNLQRHLKFLQKNNTKPFALFLADIEPWNKHRNNVIYSQIILHCYIFLRRLAVIYQSYALAEKPTCSCSYF